MIIETMYCNLPGNATMDGDSWYQSRSSIGTECCVGRLKLYLAEAFAAISRIE